MNEAIAYLRGVGAIESTRYVVDMGGVPNRKGGRDDQAPYLVSKLFTPPGGNAKLAADDGGGRYLVMGLSLAPSTVNGLTRAGRPVNLCPSAGKCATVCLFGSGQNRTGVTVTRARVAKSRLWITDPAAFKSLMVAELLSFNVQAIREGKTLAVRLNVFSDIAWERYFPEVLIMFPDVQFYDYTKIPGRVGRTPANYHLTFSRDERNETAALSMLARGDNVSVVFEDHSFPETWNGFPVVDGTTGDLRFLDPAGSVVALAEKDTELHGAKYQGKRNSRQDTSGFVLPTSTSNAHNQPVALA